MPTYDRTCQACGWSAIDVWEPVNHEAPDCPTCGQPTVRAWLTKATAVIGDEMDHWQVNGTKEPIHFTQRSERRRWLKENGFGERVQHVGVDGSDKSPHTRRWEAMDAYTMNNARILLERAASEPTRNEPHEQPMKVRTYTGDVGDATWKEFQRAK